MSNRCQQCDRFSGYLGSQYLVCAIHPSGPNQTPCPDFTEVIEDWQPLGAFYEGDQLIIDWAGYLTSSERLEVLVSHPYFSGICPKCGARFGDSRPIHYDCRECGWIDDSIN
ncbi:hypothetical protein [Acaryochloris marina]|uniref:Uncharacterized protein n=1 Tax=Acaryochloris marina (strain MBIC 11017) TaxID=329726 RepID=A8ZPG3_ACAM1|nr:hypothetical protein [Acaryochloris marina]ABW32899.1 hypothetical protein AM1_E0130 [Acaryochloris marina MBIC11017]